MIDEVLVFLRDQLNQHLSATSGAAPTESREDVVVLIDGDKMDPIEFRHNAVSVLLANVEEETVLRAADPFRRTLDDGTQVSISPPVRLNLYVLFAARFKQYQQGLGYLSSVIQYFQGHRVLDQRNAPGLNPAIERLVVELVTLSFSETNEVWGALRTTYLPSVLYRIRMVVLEDEDAFPGPELVDAQRSLSQ